MPIKEELSTISFLLRKIWIAPFLSQQFINNSNELTKNKKLTYGLISILLVICLAINYFFDFIHSYFGLYDSIYDLKPILTVPSAVHMLFALVLMINFQAVFHFPQICPLSSKLINYLLLPSILIWVGFSWSYFKLAKCQITLHKYTLFFFINLVPYLFITHLVDEFAHLFNSASKLNNSFSVLGLISFAIIRMLIIPLSFWWIVLSKITKLKQYTKIKQTFFYLTLFLFLWIPYLLDQLLASIISATFDNCGVIHIAPPSAQ